MRRPRSGYQGHSGGHPAEYEPRPGDVSAPVAERFGHRGAVRPGVSSRAEHLLLKAAHDERARAGLRAARERGSARKYRGKYRRPKR